MKGGYESRLPSTRGDGGFEYTKKLQELSQRIQELEQELANKIKCKEIEYTPFGIIDYTADKMEQYFRFVKMTTENTRKKS